MGYYIEVPHNRFKTNQLVELYNAKIVDNPQWDEKIGLICVIDNGLWEAAAYAYSWSEYNYFIFGMGIEDTRPQIWVQMDKAKAEKLSGFSP